MSEAAENAAVYAQRIMQLERELAEARRLVDRGQSYAIDAQDMISGSREYKEAMAAFIVDCDAFLAAEVKP